MSETKRLFVGGLFMGVTEEDLRTRFSQFGEITSVAIKHRHSEEGDHEKSFAHLNINSTPADLNKCISLYNKTRWKGKELQLQLAKDNFIDRLKKERESPAQEKTVKKKQVASVLPAKPLTIPGATPGTEVPGQKDWIVAKYCEVLPVVKMRTRDKKKITKIDPSKYVHNLKRFSHKKKSDNVTDETSADINNLTWQINQSEKDITKRQQGKFPAFTPPTQKKKILPKSQPAVSESHPHGDESDDNFQVIAIDDSNVMGVSGENRTLVPAELDEDSADSDDTDEIIRFTKSREQTVATPSEQRIRTLVADSDKKSKCSVMKNTDVSENSGKQIIKSHVRSSATPSEPKILGADKQISKKNKSPTSKNATVSKLSPKKTSTKVADVVDFIANLTSDESDRDSADTDEIISHASAKKNKKKSTPVKDSSQSVYKKNTDSPRLGLLSSCQFDEFSPGFESVSMETGHRSHGSEDEDLLDVIERTGRVPQYILSQKVPSQGCHVSTPYHAVSRPQNKAKNENISPRCEGNKTDTDDTAKHHIIPSPGKVTTKPEEDSSASDDDDRSNYSNSCSSNDDRREKMITPRNTSSKTPDKPLDASKAARTDNSKSDSDDSSSSDSEEDHSETSQVSAKKLTATYENNCFKPVRTKSQVQRDTYSDSSNTSSEEEDSSPEDEATMKSKKKPAGQIHVISKKIKSSVNEPSESESMESSSSSDSNKSQSVTVATSHTKKSASKEPISDQSSSESDTDSDSSDQEKSLPTVTKASKSLNISDSRTPVSPPGDNAKHQKPAAKSDNKTRLKPTNQNLKGMQELANKKRLESLKQRQTEAKAQKSLVQEALKAVDKKAASSKHIKFDSDSQSDSDAESVTMVTDAQASVADKTIKGSISENKAKLFDSSDEEEKEGATSVTNTEDTDMFRFKPQFEGKAGQKLMGLQSRYRNDERFRIDERFVEEDESEDDESMGSHEAIDDTEAEKLRSLDILKSVVGEKAMATGRKSEKKPTFKSMSSMHFDPSREDHSQFEIKTTPKEKKQKKDKLSEKDKEPVEVVLPEVSKERFYEVSSSLKGMFGTQQGFSFLGGATEKGTEFSFLGAKADGEKANTDVNAPIAEAEATPNKVVTADNFSWGDKFSDESSDEEIDQDKDVKGTSMDIPTPKETKHTFFFVNEDPRIQEGIDFFHRKEDMETIREVWSENRPGLVESYRMKRKRITRTNNFSNIKKMRS